MFGLNAQEAAFRKASNEMLALPPSIAQSIPLEDCLNFYKYYKQATIGDINVPQPNFLDAKANKKWWAWASVKGVSRQKAMEAYIGLTAPYRSRKS
jgi:diazepam-binding inhibitor (GABA receptor modulating acyl-CoA-binding protein)